MRMGMLSKISKCMKSGFDLKSKVWMLYLMMGMYGTFLLNAQKEPDPFRMTPEGIRYKILKKGNGPNVKNAMRLYLNYAQGISPDTIFASNEGQPFPFIVGEREGLKGWDLALMHLRVGDSALFIIPPHLAYGPRKVGPVKPNSSLYLYVKVLKQEEAYYHSDKADTIQLSLNVKKVKRVEGKQTLTPYLYVELAFTGYIKTPEGYRRLFQSSFTNSKNAFVQLGTGKLIKGLDIGVETMRIGEKATFIIPPEVGYGNTKSGMIPANSTLYYDIEVIREYDPFLKFTTNDTLKTASGIKILKQNKTSGDTVNSENVISFFALQYYKDAQGHPHIYHNTYETGSPVSVRVDAKTTLKGLSEGLSYFRKGEKGLILIPPHLGFGASGKGSIPPGANLYCELEITDIKPFPFFQPLNKADTLLHTCGIRYLEVRKNDQGRTVTLNDSVLVAYTGYYYKNGRRYIFDSSRETGQLPAFKPGTNRLIKGFSQGVEGMKEQEARTFIIPFALAYGAEGVPAAGIPPSTNLYFDIELVKICNAPNRE